jgi:hypothetical protein
MAQPSVAQVARSKAGAPISEKNSNVELTIDLAIKVGEEASQLSSSSERIEIQLGAAQALSNWRREDAVRLLDMALATIGETLAAKNVSTEERRRALTLRGDILALYSKLDHVRANKLDRNSATVSNDTDEVNKPAKEEGIRTFTARQRADYLLKMALAQLNSDPKKASEIALASLDTGKVSLYLDSLPPALLANGNRGILDTFDTKLGIILANVTSTDYDDHRAIVYLIQSDPDMPASARAALIRFLLNSLQQMVQAIRESQLTKLPLALSPDTIKTTYTLYRRSVRGLVAQHASDKLAVLDAMINELALIVPNSWLDFEYELWTIDSAEEQMARAVKTNDTQLRDVRLTSFIVRALSKKVPNSTERYLDLASAATERINDLNLKAKLSDCLLLAEIEKAVREKNYALAEEKALKISRLDWRAWGLASLGSVLAKQNPSTALNLFREALSALDKSSPSARKTELGFYIAGLLSNLDQLRAFDAASLAVRSANQIGEEPETELATPGDEYLKLLYIHIGDLRFSPGEMAKSVSIITVPPNVGQLGLKDWLAASQIGQAIQQRILRLRYQLAICTGVLSSTR